MIQNTTNSNKTLYKRLLLRLILVVCCAAFFIYGLPRLIHMFFPFVIAFVTAAVLNPIVNKINHRLGISRRIIAIIVDLLVFLLVAGLIGTLVYSIVNEVVVLAVNIQSNWDEILASLESLDSSFAWLKDILPPQMLGMLDGVEEKIVESIQSVGTNLLGWAITATTTLTTMAGNFFINTIITISAAYFVIADFNSISARVKKHVGAAASKYISLLKRAVSSALSGYVRSQLLLAFFAFVVNFIALLIYGQPYALLIGLFLGFIDLLPIVGTIAVNVPWGIFEWVAGDMNKGIFLICLGVGYFLLRKVVEPKIMGSQTGLHPLAALMSMYVGLQFSGVWGAILGPMVLMVLVNIAKSGIFDNTILDLKDLSAIITKAFTRDAAKDADSDS